VDDQIDAAQCVGQPRMHPSVGVGEDA
jgi:hypothetical protein